MGGKGSGRKPTKQTAEKPKKKAAKREPTEAKRQAQSRNSKKVDRDTTNDKNGISRFSYKLWQRLQDFEPITLENEEVVSQRIMDFFALCDEMETRPLTTLLAYMLDMNVQQLVNVVSERNKSYHGVTSASRRHIQNAYDFLNVNLEKNIQSENASPVKWFFLAKNHFGYRDESVKVVENRSDQLQIASAEDVAAKYAKRLGQPTLPLLEIEAEYEVPEE